MRIVLNVAILHISALCETFYSARTARVCSEQGQPSPQHKRREHMVDSTLCDVILAFLEDTHTIHEAHRLNYPLTKRSPNYALPTGLYNPSSQLKVTVNVTYKLFGFKVLF